MMKMRMRRILRISLILIVSFILSVWIIDQWVWRSTKAQMYSDLESLPHHKVGLLLGTSKYVRQGWINQYYRYRIEAAVALFKAGRIDYVLVSGDNRQVTYNEPETMQADLIAAGVPADRIVLDYAGFRTLDSIMRCRYVFGESEITIISQPFHNARALFLANHKGIKAIAYNAQDVNRKYGLKVQLREKGARVKMLLDLMFGKEPKFYGPRINIG
jgi:SanA protein